MVEEQDGHADRILSKRRMQCSEEKFPRKLLPTKGKHTSYSAELDHRLHRQRKMLAPALPPAYRWFGPRSPLLPILLVLLPGDQQIDYNGGAGGVNRRLLLLARETNSQRESFADSELILAKWIMMARKGEHNKTEITFTIRRPNVEPRKAIGHLRLRIALEACATSGEVENIAIDRLEYSTTSWNQTHTCNCSAKSSKTIWLASFLSFKRNSGSRKTRAVHHKIMTQPN